MAKSRSDALMFRTSLEKGNCYQSKDWFTAIINNSGQEKYGLWICTVRCSLTSWEYHKHMFSTSSWETNMNQCSWNIECDVATFPSKGKACSGKLWWLIRMNLSYQEEKLTRSQVHQKLSPWEITDVRCGIETSRNCFRESLFVHTLTWGGNRPEIDDQWMSLGVLRTCKVHRDKSHWPRAHETHQLLCVLRDETCGAFYLWKRKARVTDRLSARLNGARPCSPTQGSHILMLDWVLICPMVLKKFHQVNSHTWLDRVFHTHLSRPMSMHGNQLSFWTIKSCSSPVSRAKNSSRHYEEKKNKKSAL